MGDAWFIAFYAHLLLDLLCGLTMMAGLCRSGSGMNAKERVLGYLRDRRHSPHFDAACFEFRGLTSRAAQRERQPGQPGYRHAIAVHGLLR